MTSRTDMFGIMIAAGRLGLASLFILGGVNKLAHYGQFVDRMELAGLPFAQGLLPIVILLELGGGLLVAFGRSFAAQAAFALAAFTIATNLVFHDFWNMTGDRAALEISLFFKNVSIAGALLLVAGSKLRDRSSSTGDAKLSA